MPQAHRQRPHNLVEVFSAASRSLTGGQLGLPADSSRVPAPLDNLQVVRGPSIPHALVLDLQGPVGLLERALDLANGQDSADLARVALVDLVPAVPAVLLLQARLRVQAAHHRVAVVVDRSSIRRRRKAR